MGGQTFRIEQLSGDHDRSLFQNAGLAGRQAAHSVLLSRLAVSQTYQGRGLGGILLADALKRTSRAEFGVFAMVVDAKDQAAARFYEHFGLKILPGEGPRRLCLPVASAHFA